MSEKPAGDFNPKVSQRGKRIETPDQAGAESRCLPD